MARYNITNAATGQVMFGGEYPTFKACVQDAARLGVALWGANLANQDLSGVSFAGSEMQGANLSGSNFSGCNMTNVDLSNANMSNANVTTASFDIQTNVFGANLTGIIESIQLDPTVVP